jgi:hypothetical protein
MEGMTMAVKKFYHDIDLVSVGQLLNARLHNVDSTARATLAATPLTVDHKGLQVWDTDDNAPYIWNGVAWLRDALVITGDVVFRGTIDASVSLDAQATAEAGNQYVVSTAGTPSMTGVTFTPSSAVELGDVILFTSSSAATVLQRNLEDAIVDADFASAGLMTTDGSGNYTVTTNNSSNWNTAFGWGDHAAQGYITSETNDLTSAVTWANVPNANITESSVTQHQGALSINESQITFTSAFIELTDLSVGTNAAASGSGGIAYNNTTGVVTYTPPELSGIATNANAIGTLSSLETTQKANLVAAINEMRGALPKTYFNGTVTLTADTEITIAHALELTNKDSYIITVADTTGSQVSVDIDSVDTNNLKITSSVALTGIKVAIIGF